MDEGGKVEVVDACARNTDAIMVTYHWTGCNEITSPQRLATRLDWCTSRQVCRRSVCCVDGLQKAAVHHAISGLD